MGRFGEAKDIYFTPLPLAKLICEVVREEVIQFPVTRMLEPGCGTGSFLKATKTTWPNVKRLGVERVPFIAQEARVKGHHVIESDFLKKRFKKEYDLIIGNPPYSMAREFVEKSLSLLSLFGNAVFLLRLDFLGSKKRLPFWRKTHPQKIFALARRPSFSECGGTDRYEYMVCVWGRGFEGPTEFGWIDNTKVSNKSRSLLFGKLNIKRRETLPNFTLED